MRTININDLEYAVVKKNLSPKAEKIARHIIKDMDTYNPTIELSEGAYLDILQPLCKEAFHNTKKAFQYLIDTHIEDLSLAFIQGASTDEEIASYYLTVELLNIKRGIIK